MYDLIVIGLGAMGSATAYHAASRGHRVLGLDAYQRNHANGSSHGRSRIIRESYAEGPEYVPLVQRAYKLWRDLEEESSRSLLTIIGGVYIGSPDTEIVRGVLRSAETHGLACDYLSAAELMSRFPGFRVPEDMVAVYEANGGVLDAEACVGVHLDLAARHGAELRYGEPVLRWAADGSGVRVETAAGSYTGERLVIAAGPWIGGLLADLPLPLAVWRVYNTFFEPTRPEFEVGRCPFYLLEVPEGTYYGLPSLPGQGLKAGRHDAGEVSTPQNVRRTVEVSEVEAIRSVLERYMPGAAGALKATTTCVYTVTPDADFVIDRHPEHPQVVYASPCSGHGFKFSSAIGEVLCDLALEGTSAFDVAVFSAERFGIGVGRK
ncbi:MAG TPA: N-methyl-L-tryptophan oxidase [Chloroflexia bacterium]|nr:N-methyl-L-tryptophan oxidase [Chloroflexia bacterium]